MPPVRIPTETPVLRTARTVLRPFRPSDVDERQTLGQDPEILQMFGVRPAFSEPVPMSEHEAQDWYDQLIGDPNPLQWAIEHEGRLAGTTSLHSLREGDEKAQLGIGLLDRRCWGRGLGEEVTREVVRFGFEEVGLHRIGLKVFAHNERAIRCYLRCGFVEEGREREAAHVGGAWRDDVIMGILAADLAAPPVGPSAFSAAGGAASGHAASPRTPPPSGRCSTAGDAGPSGSRG